MKVYSGAGIILFLILSTTLFGQDKTATKVGKNYFEVTFAPSAAKYSEQLNGKFKILNYYEFTDPSSPGTFKLPSYNLILAIPPYSTPKFSVISKSEEIINSALPDVNPLAVTKNDSTIVMQAININNAKRIEEQKPVIQVNGYFWLRDFYCVQLKINTYNFNSSDDQISFIKNLKFNVNFGQQFSFKQNAPLKIISRYDKELNKIIYNNNIAEQFRSSPKSSFSDTAAAWINYNSTYLKIGTASDGLFKIYKSDLESFGINTAGINPATFQLFNYGKEVPIYVKGENTGIFSDSDYIEFFGTKNYPKISYRMINNLDQEYNEYLNRYTDTSFYFLTWGIKNGLRGDELNTFKNGIPDTLDYYNQTDHYETNTFVQNLYDDEVENQTPNWNRNKSWYWDWFYVQRRTFNFQTPDIYPDKPVKFYFKLVSAGSDVPTNSHNISFYVNGIKLDSQVVNRFQQVLLNGSVNSSLLLNSSNQLNIQNFKNSTSTNYLAIDWYDIEYPRYLKLNNDSLLFQIDSDLSEGERVIKITDLSDSINTSALTVFKVKPYLEKVDSFKILKKNLFFTDTVSGRDTYVVIESSKIQKPIFYYKKQFADFNNSGNQTDYIAITNTKFINSAQNYINQISSMYSIETSLFNVQDIFDEFGYGYPTAESIKLFIKHAMQNWQEPKPSYLVLIGDADYDYKHYRFLNDGVMGGGNFVPSYGDPVSDCWYSILNDSLPIPQLMTGRIPINSSSELDYYLSKVQNNFNSQYNDWNKRYLFFSGGNGNNSTEIDQLKKTNQDIINNYVAIKPIAGDYTHFYKTINPQSDFGPYTQDQINNAISNGGVFISYIGHSGTATWDNGINTVHQLNNSVNRNPFMSDFGCSTVKFAEPDIVCFGERFLLRNDGQAIGYIGNSSLGFTSTATTVPSYFYGSLFEDSLRNIGSAHLNAKLKMFDRLGTSNVYKVFAYTNSLLGDPVIDIKIPAKPNLKIVPSDFLISNNSINEDIDSVNLKIVIENPGTVINDSVDIALSHFVNNSLLEQYQRKILMPDYLDTVSVWLKIKNLPGEHKVSVDLDPSNKVQEIYKSDNSSSFTFNVSSLAVRDLITQEVENSSLKEIELLNPSKYSNDTLKILYQISSNKNFVEPNQYLINVQPFATKITLPSLNNNQRYWIKYKIEDQAAQYSMPRSFYNSEGSVFYLIDSLSFGSQRENSVKYDGSSEKLTNDSIKISVISAGGYAGATCIISKNGTNLLSNSFFAGMGIVVFEKNTLVIDTSAWFKLFNNPTGMNGLIELINSIPQGKIVAMGVSDDAANNITPDLKNAIKTLGSTKIDTLKFRGSWALIGEKGAAPGHVKEEIRGPYDGIIQIDSTFIVPNNYGSMVTKDIGPAAEWINFQAESSTPLNSKIKYRILGIKSNGIVDSLNNFTLNNNNADLSFVDARKYKFIKILSEFYSGDNSASPGISSLGVNFNSLPELGTNYQVVSVNKDSLVYGENESLQFFVYNVGGVPADSFNIKVDVVNSDNIHSTVFNSLVDSLNPNSRKEFNVSYSTISGTGAKSFYISIDPENKIPELYKDNNVFSIPFFVKPDTSRPTLNVTFDGINILDGDYVSANPKIRIELNDNSVVPITDTSAVSIFLNGNPIYYIDNQSLLTYNFNTSNPKYAVSYTPVLKDGIYNIEILAKNSTGISIDSVIYNKSFTVLGEPKLLDVYNYPNPFSKDTYFTFKLAQVPDELKIRIFTVAGRLIKEIIKYPSDLKYDFNRVYWDGRDADGDQLANGVYFYKITMIKGDKKDNIVQKIAIVR